MALRLKGVSSLLVFALFGAAAARFNVGPNPLSGRTEFLQVEGDEVFGSLSSGPPAPTGPWAKISIGAADGSSAPSAMGGGSVGATLGQDGSVSLLTMEDGAAASGKFAAWGNFGDSLDSVGWSALKMHLSDDQSVEDGVKMYAAGAVEGFITAERIKQFYHNSRGLVTMNTANDAKLPALKTALANMIEREAADAVDASASRSPTEAQARLLLLQSWGIRDGYAMAAKQANGGAGDDEELSLVDVFILNSDGVVDELLTAYGPEEDDDMLMQKHSSSDILVQRRSTSLRRGYRRQTAKKPQLAPEEKKEELPALNGHCTGLVRLAPQNNELFLAHTTWEPFSEMTRIWKVYDFPLKDTAARKISFSSYPGCVSSTDDYYLIDTGLAITETTLNLPKKQQYPAEKAGQVKTPDFMRIMAANRLAQTAEDWVNLMDQSATGTYSSQWLVLDYKKFKPGQAPLPAGTFFVLEQAPGVSHSEDRSETLQEQGYWASYDRAYFDQTRALTGDDDTEATSPPDIAELFSKDHTPRAQIVKQTINDVSSLADMRAEMTRNHGTDEPVDKRALQIPAYAIDARDDLRDDQGDKNSRGSPEGGVDAKVTSSCLFQQGLKAVAVSSPSHTSLPAFRWQDDAGNDIWPGYPHEGLPNEANFDWVSVDPSSSDSSMLGSVDSAGC